MSMCEPHKHHRKGTIAYECQRICIKHGCELVDGFFRHRAGCPNLPPSLSSAQAAAPAMTSDDSAFENYTGLWVTRDASEKATQELLAAIKHAFIAGCESGRLRATLGTDAQRAESFAETVMRATAETLGTQDYASMPERVRLLKEANTRLLARIEAAAKLADDWDSADMDDAVPINLLQRALGVPEREESWKL